MPNQYARVGTVIGHLESWPDMVQHTVHPLDGSPPLIGLGAHEFYQFTTAECLELDGLLRAPAQPFDHRA